MYPMMYQLRDHIINKAKIYNPINDSFNLKRIYHSTTIYKNNLIIVLLHSLHHLYNHILIFTIF